MKIASTEEFVNLCVQAIAEDYNRQVDIAKLCSVIDQHGTHVCWFTMLHEHKHGVICDPHLRTMWKIKLNGTMEPADASLDISFENFNKLSDADVEKVRKDAVK